jgi:hypothetical protein
MSASVKLSSKLAADEELNGVDALHDDLLDEPTAIRCALVWFDAPRSTRDAEAGTEVPTIRIRKIEPIGLAAEVPDVIRKAVADAYHDRSGVNPLPFDQVEVDGE